LTTTVFIVQTAFIMIPSRMRYLAAWLLLGTLLIGAGSGGYVLCHDDDGRRHIEVTVFGSCDPGQGAGGTFLSVAAPAGAAGEPHCGSCSDAELSTEHLQQRHLQSMQAPPALSPAQPAAAFAVCPTLQNHLVTSQSRRSPSAYLALRSTVLRC